MIARRLARSDEGATILEFAFVAPVLTLVLIGLCDLAHTLYMTAALQGIVQKTARDATLEDYSKPDAQDKLDKKVEDVVKALLPSAKVDEQRRYYKSYAEASAKKAEPWTDTDKDGTCDDGEPFTDINNNLHWDADGGNDEGGAQDRTVYTVTVTYARLFPVGMFVKGLPSTTTLKASTVLENQPYADQTQYGSPGSGTCD